MRTVFIYALKCPITGLVRYVGKSKTPARRLQGHLTSKGRCHRSCWIAKLKALGHVPILEILDEVPVKCWPQWEVAYIEFFQEQGCNLTNATPGGEDPPVARKGRKFTAEHCANISASATGRKLSPETCAKLSAAGTGRKKSPETCSKLSAAATGRKQSPEARAKIRAFRLGRVPWNKGFKLHDPFAGQRGREYLKVS